MKHTRIRTVSLLLASVLLCGCLSLCSASAETPGEILLSANILSLTAEDAVPEYQWQKKAVFPDWKGYTDDTLAMNSMLSFSFRHGQGTVWLTVSEEVESFVLYVNGCPCDTSRAHAGAWSLDISGAARDGMNTLQVSNILPLGLKEAVTVMIPYPEVLEGGNSLEGIHPDALRLISDIIETDVAYGFTSA